MNPRPLPCQGSALPLRHSPMFCCPLYTVNAGYTAAAILKSPSLLRDEFSSFACRFSPGAGSLRKHTCLLLPIINLSMAPRVHITLYARQCTLSIALKLFLGTHFNLVRFTGLHINDQQFVSSQDSFETGQNFNSFTDLPGSKHGWSRCRIT